MAWHSVLQKEEKERKGLYIRDVCVYVCVRGCVCVCARVCVYVCMYVRTAPATGPEAMSK